MRFLILACVALGVVCGAPQGFLRDTPEVEAARNEFIREYNRLARLAAEAPDIDIYGEATHHQFIPALVSNVVQRPAAVVAQPVAFAAPPQTVDTFSFATTLGGHSLFVPSVRTFSAPSQVIGQAVTRFEPAFHSVIEPSQLRWPGPFADTVPAGLSGAPRPVQDTPEVQAAKAAHFQAWRTALANARSSGP